MSFTVSNLQIFENEREKVENINELDVHGSMHHNINLIEITNKMRLSSHSAMTAAGSHKRM
jgi:hypothetical protein